MAQNSMIANATASGEEVFQIVNNVEQALDGCRRPTAIIALIAVVLQLQYPNLSPEDRVQGVKDVTRYICLWLDEKMMQEGEKPVIN